MKKLMMMTVVACSIMLSACSDGLITSPSTGGLETPDHTYEVDTWGTNSEVYEFTPKSNSNMSCVFVMLDSGDDMGLQCFPKQSNQ